MTQKFLLSKLAKFVEPSNPALANSLTTINGVCYALSVCYSAMNCNGKLEWWKAALKEITEKASNPAQDINEALAKRIIISGSRGYATTLNLFVDVQPKKSIRNDLIPMLRIPL